MGYKVIVSDLDETLLNDAHIVPEENIYWIKKARLEHNIRFVPATGRGFNLIHPELKQLDLDDASNEYSISFNGAALTENKDMKVLSFHGLDFEIMKQLFEFGLTKDVCIHVYTDKHLYIYRLSDSERERLTHQKLDPIFPKDENVEFLRNEKIAKILYQNIDVPYLMSLEDELRPITDNKVSISYSSNRYMEFNALGVDKGQGIYELGHLLNIDIKDIIAVGDNYNDEAMLKVAGLSVAAFNAVDDIKKICDYTTKNNNNEGVLAEVIRKFIYHEDI